MESENTETAKAETSNAEPTNAETSNAEPTNVETSNAEPTNAETSNAETTNAETSNAEPTNAKTPNAKTPNAKTPNAELAIEDTANTESQNTDTETINTGTSHLKLLSYMSLNKESRLSLSSFSSKIVSSKSLEGIKSKTKTSKKKKDSKTIKDSDTSAYSEKENKSSKNAKKTSVTGDVKKGTKRRLSTKIGVHKQKEKRTSSESTKSNRSRRSTFKRISVGSIGSINSLKSEESFSSLSYETDEEYYPDSRRESVNSDILIKRASAVGKKKPAEGDATKRSSQRKSSLKPLTSQTEAQDKITKRKGSLIQAHKAPKKVRHARHLDEQEEEENLVMIQRLKDTIEEKKREQKEKLKETEETSKVDFTDIDMQEEVSSSESSIIELPESHHQAFLTEFLEKWSILPTIDEISEDEDTTERKYSERKSKSVDQIGRFIDPVTGKIKKKSIDASALTLYKDKSSIESSSSEEFEEEEEEEEEAEEEGVIEKKIKRKIPVDEKFFYGRENLTQKNWEYDAASLHADFIEEPTDLDQQKELDIQYIARDIELDLQKYLQERENEIIRAEKNRISLMVFQYLNEMIEKVVDIIEHPDPLTILRKNLNKTKLVATIIELTMSIKKEQYINTFLNKKTVDYFKRKRDFHSIQENSIVDHPTDLKKYQKVSKRLDDLLGKENEIIVKTQETVQKLKNDLQMQEENANSDIRDFEQLILDTIGHNRSHQLKNHLKAKLEQMSETRDRLSETRLKLIKRQHQAAFLINRLDKLEDVGEGYRVHQYEQLQHEVLSITAKISERNNEIGRIQSRFYTNMDSLSHYGEKKSMIRHFLHIQEEEYEDLQEVRQKMRNKLYELKIKRSLTRQEIANTSYKGGLVDKPALMYDYDGTIEKINEKEKLLQELQNKADSLEQKIDAFKRDSIA